jgi:hypothetical protein
MHSSQSLIAAQATKAIDAVRGFVRLGQDDYRGERRVLMLVLQAIIDDLHNTGGLKPRTLRGFQDICTLVARSYEDTPIEAPVFELRDAISSAYPVLDGLPRLAGDFGKQNPF